MRVTVFAIPVCIALALVGCEPTGPADNRVLLEPVAAELTGVVGGPTESPPAVRATRAADGSPLSGILVEFRLPQVPQNQLGAITTSLDTTDASGIATAGSWVLGRVAGVQTLYAFAFDYALSTVLNARARAGAPVLFIVPMEYVQYVLGVRQPLSPTVHVRDNWGNGVEGIDATFSPGQSGGSVGNLATKTNANGSASAGAWTLPPTPGAYSVKAVVGTRVFDFTAHKVDSSSLSWYGLDSIRQGKTTILPVAWNIKSTRLGLTPFDPCFCVNLQGAAFEVTDYLNGNQWYHSGSFTISAGKAFAWGYDELKVSGTGLTLLRQDYYSYDIITYFYSRRN